MEISKKVYNILFYTFWILIVALVGLLYLYNESRNEMVEEAIAQGYTCEKNVFGFYKKCYSAKYLKETGHVPITNWTVVKNQYYNDLEGMNNGN